MKTTIDMGIEMGVELDRHIGDNDEQYMMVLLLIRGMSYPHVPIFEPMMHHLLPSTELRDSKAFVYTISLLSTPTQLEREGERECILCESDLVAW
jgi:hypothetical protein